jgi:hypothetical protein
MYHKIKTKDGSTIFITAPIDSLKKIRKRRKRNASTKLKKAKKRKQKKAVINDK